jgi:tetratricopeptide (TPR) repeat protein
MPARFNLLFYRENNIVEYTLYHPFGDGPEELLQTGFLLGADQNKAIDVLEGVSMDLAKASLTVDLSEPVSNFLSRRNSIDPMTLYVRPSMSVDRNLADIDTSPQRRVDTDYIDAYLRYGSKVSAEYSFKFVPNRKYFSVLAGPKNTTFVHYSIEMDPENFSLEANEDGTRFYTTLDVSLEVKDLKENLIAYNDNTAAIELSASQLQQAQAYPFVYQDNFPLVVPGNYKLTVTVRNRVTKQFTVAEEEIHVPALDGKPSLSDIVVGYKEEIVPTSREDEYLTFQVGNTRVYPTVENIFAIGETVHVLTQAQGAASDFTVRFTLLNGEETLHESEKALENGGGLILEQVPLLKISGGNYQLRAELVDPAGAVVAEKFTEVNVSPRSFIPRPAFVYRRGFNTGVAGLLSLARGQQLLALGQVESALSELEDAVAADNPELPMAQWKLAGALIYVREADRALELLLPLKDAYPNEYEVAEGMAFAYYIKKEFVVAVEHFEKAISIRSPDIIVLNALGDCYQELGRMDEAREAFELSLQLNPGQAGVKERIQSLSE